MTVATIHKVVPHNGVFRSIVVNIFVLGRTSKTKQFKQQVIDILHLQREIKDFSGKTYPQDLEIYHAEKDTDKAIYKYTLDNYFDGDNDFTLVIERYSKTACVYSDTFGTLIPRKTTKLYALRW